MRLHVLQRVLAASLLAFGNTLRAANTNGVHASVQEALQGHFVYMRNCVFCHGRRGDGKGEMGLTVQPPPRDFGAGVFKYRSTPSGFLPTDDDLARTIREGIPDTAMPAFATLPPRDLHVVIEYVKTFSPKWRRPEYYAAPIQVPKRPDWFGEKDEFARHVERGHVLFGSGCAPCHGTMADGNGSVTNLMDSWDHPSPARDLRLPYLRSGPRLEDIYKVLVTGIDGTPMPSFGEGTTEEQRWELVAFVEQLRRDNRNRP